MDRKARMALGNTVIVASSIIGGVLLTNQLTHDQGGLLGLTATPNPTATAAATSGSTPAPSSSSTTATSTVKKGMSATISYRYGNVQVEAIKSGSKLTAVHMIQSDATNGRAAAYPMLVKAALSANGTNFGNISGATFTTDAFKQALDSALSKIG
ncbi:MAG: hypothetical protein RL556_580 [Actinomycetota bacterium]|jgi:uncharacterized protein with FMN-binding domain